MSNSGTKKGGPKLAAEQREQLLEWLAADYSSTLILQWAEERKWPRITKQAISYHRRECIAEIEALRKARHQAALNSGLGLREERIMRLMEHADELHEIMWVPDPKTGKYHNEKAWRETLRDIAEELGHRTKSIDLRSSEGLAVRVEYVNDWRGGNTPALPASGAAASSVGNAALQLAGGGAALAQDDDGDGDSGGSGDAG